MNNQSMLSLITIITLQKKTLLLCVLLCLPKVVFATDSEVKLYDYLLSLDKRVDKAIYYDADVEFLAEVLTEDFLYVHSGASPIQTKEQLLNGLPAPGLVTKFERNTRDIRRQGDTAIVSGFIVAGVGSYKMLKFHLQRVYIKKDEHWSVFSQHATLNLSEEKGLHSDAIEYIYEKYWSKL